MSRRFQVLRGPGFHADDAHTGVAASDADDPADGVAAPEVFVGRHRELGLLAVLLERARGGLPGVVFLEGDPGVGKSALVSRLVRTAGQVHVLRAAGEEFEQALAFGVVDQLRSDLAVESSDPPPADSGRGTADVLTAGAELAGLLEAVQRSRPVVLVLDDAHWADDASLQVLAFALRRLRGHRVLALVVTRGRVAERLPGSLHRIMVGEIGHRLTLDGLSADELAELAGQVRTGPLSRWAVTRLHEHTRGNPLHARALFEELPPESQWEAARPLPAPRSFAVLVLGRLARCAPETERLVVAAAVLGGAGPLDIVARLAEVEEPLPALDAAVAAHLLTERPGRTGWPRVEFTHPLIQAAVYQDLGHARRSALHERAAALVPEEHMSLRHRVAAATLPDATLAREVAAKARGLAATSVSFAADALAAAARLSPVNQDRERYLLDAVELMLLAGRTAEARSLAPMLREFAQGPRQLLVLGQLALFTESTTAADALLARAWQRCDPAAEPDLAARIAAHTAGVARLAGQAGAAVMWARRAIAADIDTAATLHAADVLLLGLGAGGSFREAFEHAGPHSSGAALPPGPDYPVGLGMARLWSGDTVLARRELAAALAQHSQPGSGGATLLLTTLSGLAEADYRLGRWDDALRHCAQAIAAAEDPGQGPLLGPPHAVCVLPHAGRGDWELAEAHLQVAAAVADAAPDPITVGWAATARAVLAAARQDPVGVVAAVQPILDLLPCDSLDTVGVLPWHEPYLDALIQLDRLAQARNVLATCRAQAQQRDGSALRTAVQRLEGRLLAAQGAPEQAETAYATGMEHAQDCQQPFEQAQLELAFGGLLRRQGRRARAGALLRSAQERFADLGARPYLQRCDHELRACGLGQRAQPGQRGLTGQERAVAQLIAAGRSNREAAQDLVVSVKTIEFHLGNVFSKLGVRSRSQLTLELLKTGVPG
jgi:DNA-binding NarL/FixJ family response regulator